MKFSIAAVALSFSLIGCTVNRYWTVEGNISESSPKEYFASIERVTIAEGEAVIKGISYRDLKLKATGFRLHYNRQNKENVIEFSNLSGTYRIDGSEEIPLNTEIVKRFGASGYPENQFYAYLIPERSLDDIEPLYPSSEKQIKPIPSGSYTIQVTFLEDGKPRKLDFKFMYDRTTDIRKPQLDPYPY